ncbi:3011_t:CDS:1, partial [Racocetra persica]
LKKRRPPKWLKSSTECNSTISKKKERALIPLDKNMQSNRSIFKKFSNAYIKADQDTEALNNSQVQEKGVVNKYRCRICGGLGHNARNKKKYYQQNFS